MVFLFKRGDTISGTNNKLRNDKHDCICLNCGELKPCYAKGLCKQCWRHNYYKTRYATDKKFREKSIADNKKYRDLHHDSITAQSKIRFRNEACKILTQHSDEHHNDDDRLTTDFIADQLEKFKDKIYDDDDLKLLEH